MRRLSFFVFAMSVFAFSVLAQDSTSKPASDAKPQDKKPADSKPADPKKDKKDKNKGNDPVDTQTVFNERIANDVLGQIRDGLEGHSQRTLLGAFDGDKMDGFLNFEDQIEAYFNRYGFIRVRFRISQVSVEGNKGIILVDADIECSPQNATGKPVRKSGQLRFELEKGKKGWRVVDFRDRNFFS